MRGRGAVGNPTSRFEAFEVVAEPDIHQGEFEDAPSSPATRYLTDGSRSVISHNQSPDLPFSASLNPYRGCEHGCAYCYARPSHEFLGFSAGLDFETRIVVKPQAADLLRAELSRPGWHPQVLALSGVTDPYQPVERKLQLTRACLRVLAEFRNPVGLITKNALVVRDLDLLGRLAEHRAVRVNLSMTSLNPELARRLEPRASAPQRRLWAISELARAGIPVSVMVAPVIPGLNEHEIPDILAAAAQAGAQGAAMIGLRLPLGVAPLFEQWLSEHFPDRQTKIMNRIRAMRGGQLNDARFHHRFAGHGPYWTQIQQLFRIGLKKAGWSEAEPELSTQAFQVPGRQLTLFD